MYFLNQAFTLLLLFVFFTKSSAQTNFFDKYGKTTDESSAYYKRELVTPPSTYRSLYISNNSTYFEGKIISASTTDEAENVYAGLCKWYYKNGTIKQETNYSETGEREGISKEYYESGKVSREINFIKGSPEYSFYTEFDIDGNAVRVFFEDFENNNNEWDLYASDESESSIKNGELKLKSLTQKGTSRYINVDTDLSDFSIETSIKFTKINGKYPVTGLLFGFKDWDNYWYFTITNERFSVGQIYEGIRNIKINNDFTGDISLTDYNKLKVITNGNRLLFSINGVVQYAMNQPSFAGRNVGYVMYGKLVEATFSELMIKEFSGGMGSKSAPSGSSNIKSTGTGVIIGKDGFITTNYHVVENNSSIEVDISTDGITKSYKAKVISVDKTNDLAIIKIDDTSFASLSEIPYTVKTTNAIEVGATAYTIGYPLAFSGMGTEVKFTDGKISAKTGYDGALNSFQTSIPVQPGNSGGPIFNKNGELIGIVNAKISNADNVSYGIKASNLVSLIETIDGVSTPDNASTLLTKTLEEQIKVLSNYVVLIKIR
jgi:V8-like Glu-specific endopeptidase